MKRYLLFSYAHYYPSGGWGDFIGPFDSIDEAKAGAERVERNNAYEIVDIAKMTVVEEGCGIVEYKKREKIKWKK